MILIWVMVPYLLAVALLVVLSRLILKEANEEQLADPLSGGGLEFAPKKTARLAMQIFIGIFGLFGLLGIVSALVNGRPPIISVVFVLFALLMARILPGSITLTEAGLEQRFWLGKAKVIAWNEVRAVAVDQKQGRVTITGATGAKIQHPRQLPDRARLLVELESRCPDKMPRPDGSVPPPHPPVVPPSPVVAPPADPQA